MQAAERAGSRVQIGAHPDGDISEPFRGTADNKYLGGHPLQDVHLPYDDGAAFDDQAGLVLAVETAGRAAGENRGGNRVDGHGQIMTEARVGRLLAACLHQAILDVLPQRLDFYENWLSHEGLREGSIGLAPMSAVVGFLRTEGDAYDQVVSRAGQLAAEWTVASMSAMQRRAITWLPRGLRARAAMRIAGDVVRLVYPVSRASSSIRKNQARLEVRSSLFCSVREVQTMPLCGFYVAVAVETLRHFGVQAQGSVEQCRAMHGGTCIMRLELTNAESVPDPALAA